MKRRSLFGLLAAAPLVPAVLKSLPSTAAPSEAVEYYAAYNSVVTGTGTITITDAGTGYISTITFIGADVPYTLTDRGGVDDEKGR